MRRAYRISFFVFCSIILHLQAGAFTVSGRITDQNEKPLPFVSIYIKGTTIGSTSNLDGYYSLELNAGNYEFIYQLIGYKLFSEKVSLTKNITRNVTLQEEAVNLKEVEVGPGKEDLAYEIIRKAQKKRSYYLHQVDRYACDVYIKGLQRITAYPKKFLGKEVNLNSIIDTATGIAYLSESVSKFYFEQPDKIKETLLSSKVSGRNNAFSYNQASDLLFNFYQNLMQTGIAQRGVLSPISNTCFLSYKYKFEGSFYENGAWINKISFWPKRKGEPCFTGTLYICDSTWRIYSVDAYVTKDNTLRFLDTLRVSQVFLPVNDSVWMMFSNKFSFSFNTFGFAGNGYYTAIQTNYIVNPEVARKFFNGEMWHVNEDSNKKDSVYWDSIRPIPLTKEEITDYQRKDSLNKVWESKPYKDSVDRRSNRPKISLLWQGYRWKNSWKEYAINVSPPITGFLFNTVQGWNPSSTVSFKKWNKETRKEYEIKLHGAYGLSSKRLYLNTDARFEYNPKKLSVIEISGGRELSQFNTAVPISPVVNAIYSLLDKRNYMKLYSKDFFRIWWRHELVNGLMLYCTGEFSERSPLENNSDETWVNRSYDYTSNIPFNLEELTSFEKNRKAELNINVRIRIGQRYFTRPNSKITLGSKFPEINISWRKAIPGIAESTADYDLGSISLSDRINMKRIGRGQFLVRAGKFFNTTRMNFMDYKHFNGNQTYFTDFDFQKFQLLDYYAYSTNKYFIEGWYNQNFGGFILNKIPLLKRLKLDEIAGARYCYTEQLKHYAEFSIGLKYLVARADFVYSINNGISRYGFRFGLLL